MALPPAWIPYLSLGLGVQQLGQSQRLAEEATAGLTPEQRARLRREGTSNIGSALASRGLLDSSLYGGALANLERGIAEARNPAADILWQQALGAGQAGAGTIGNLAQMYMLQQLLGGQGGSWWGPIPNTGQATPWAGPAPFIPPYPGFG